MKSNYRRIGDIIRLVDERNTGLKVQRLLGLSISKQFIPSVANIIGTDMENYKIIRKNQFACSTMQVRRDKKMPVALLQDIDEAIISQAYPVFEVKDRDAVLPEYLMMWFSRQEFDREACFYAIGGVRGSLEWEDFCDMQLPIPSIDKQKEIVKEYNTIIDRIKLNNQLIQKLEETAQAVYKQWFVDFEFPNTEGGAYKANGGEMVESELGEIPAEWRFGTINDVKEEILDNRGKTPITQNIKENNNDYIVISAKNVKTGRLIYPSGVKYVNESMFKDWTRATLQIGDIAMTSEAPMGEIYYFAKRTSYMLSQRLFGIRADKKKSRGSYLYFWLQTTIAKKDMEGKSTGTTVSGIKQSELLKVLVLIPKIEVVILFDIQIKGILEKLEVIKDEITLLDNLKEILLSKLATMKN